MENKSVIGAVVLIGVGVAAYLASQNAGASTSDVVYSSDNNYYDPFSYTPNYGASQDQSGAGFYTLPDYSASDTSPGQSYYSFPDYSAPDTSQGIDMSAYWKINEYATYAKTIAAAEDANGIPRDLLARQLYQESHFRKDVIFGGDNASGARGIAQFLTGTAADYGLYNRNDPLASINAAARYMRDLYKRFGSWQDALAAYDWGMGYLTKWIAAGRNPATMPSETTAYVNEITADVPV